MSARLLPQLRQRYFDQNGDPLSGGLLWSYIAGTTTPTATFADQAGTVPNTNPIVLDANGEANVWIISGAYKFVLTDADGAIQWTVDNVTANNGLGGATEADEAAASAAAAAASAADAASYASIVDAAALTASSAATAAGTSATNASISASNAVSSANSALTYSGNASTSATNAGNSATAAGTSATNAANSATAAATSATNAATSETNAASTLSAATAHIASTSNPHSTTKAQVGLGNVDNTSDANKPVSTATQTALNLKADAASPSFTGALALQELSTTPLTPSAGTKKVYAKNDGKVYTLNSSGNEVQVGAGASGGSGVNYVTDGDAQGAIIGALYNDSAAAPVDGFAGTVNPAFTLTQTTTSPLRGTKSFLITKDANNRQGYGWAIDCAIEREDLYSILEINADYELPSGTYADGDVQVWIVGDPSGTPTVRQPSAYQILKTTIPGKLQGVKFQNEGWSTIRVCFHAASTSALAYTLKLDSISLGPQTKSYGPIITDWQTFTPTIVGAGTVSGATASWRRIGSSMDVRYYFTSGTPTNVTAQFGLPPGVLIAGTGVSVGKLSSNNAGGNAGGMLFAANGNSYLTIGYQDIPASNSGTQIFNAASPYYAFAESIPIQGWSSNQLLSSENGTRLIAAKYTTNTAQVLTSGTRIDFNTKQFDRTGAVTTGVSTWAFTAQEAGIYIFAGQVYAQTVPNFRFYRNGTQQNYIGGANSNMVPFNESFDLAAGEVIDLRAASSYTLDATTPYDNSITVYKLQTSHQLAASDSVSCRYTTAAGQSIPTASYTIVDFGTKDYDLTGAVTTGASWKFAPRASGVYQAKALLFMASGGSWAASKELTLAIYKNGVIYSQSSNYQVTTHSTYVQVQVNDSIRLNVGDYLDFRVYQSTGTALSIYANSTYAYASIDKVG